MKVAMLLSGGVDSSVALKLLKDEGHQLTAFYIKIWMEDKFSFLGSCPWEEDLKYAEQVCRQLKVPLEIVPLQKEYWQRVVKEAIKEVKQGRTPNPDVWCNERIKFGVFYDYLGSKFDKIASGHYAQVVERNGKFYLKRSPDPIKDQTYFLVLLSQKQLSQIIFPLGQFKKSQVRQLAKKFNLPNQNRKDSQGICFLGKIKYRDFIKEHLGVQPGKIINQQTGELMGEHQGFWFYTIGQRKDIGLAAGPWYVAAKDIKKNIIYVVDKLAKELKKEFSVTDLHWFNGQAPLTDKLKVKVRHGPKMYACQIKAKGKKILVKIKPPQGDSGIAAGQYAVFYEGKYCLGGGVIE